MDTSPPGGLRRALRALTAIGCAAAVSAPGIALADDIAVIRVVDAIPDPDTLSTKLAAALAGTGHTIINLGEVSDGTTVDFSLYDRVYISTSLTQPATSGFPASKFINYLAAGGQVVWVGEYFLLSDDAGYENEVINQVLAARVVPTVTVQGRAIQGQRCAPNATWGTCAPTDATFTPKLACGLVNGPAANMVMTMDSGAIFSGADMVDGAGALAVLMDNSWITGDGGDDPVTAAAVAAVNAEAFDEMMANVATGGPVDCDPLVVDGCSEPSECADANPCTDDICDAEGNCQNPALADDTPCDDDTVCNGAEVCLSGTCVAGTPLVVDDGDMCSVDTCDPVTGVSNTYDPCSYDEIVLFGEVNDDDGTLIGAFSCTYTSRLEPDPANPGGPDILVESVECETDDNGDLLIGPAWCSQ